MSLPFRPFVMSRIKVPLGVDVTEAANQSVVSMLNLIAQQVGRDCALHNISITPIGEDELLITVIAEASSTPSLIHDTRIN